MSPDSKSGVLEKVPWVRIPLSPLGIEGFKINVLEPSFLFVDTLLTLLKNHSAFLSFFDLFGDTNCSNLSDIVLSALLIAWA